MSKALTTPYVCYTNAFIANALQKYVKYMRISYLLADFLGKKVFLQQNNPNNNRKTTDKWSITLGLAQASVSLEV